MSGPPPGFGTLGNGAATGSPRFVGGRCVDFSGSMVLATGAIVDVNGASYLRT